MMINGYSWCIRQSIVFLNVFYALYIRNQTEIIMANQMKSKFHMQSFAMWLIPTLFFAFQFIPRLWLGKISVADHTMHQLSIDVQQFGYINSVYYFGYAGMQIPVAMMLDRFSPRYVISGLIFLLSIAFLIFTLTDHWIVACLARFLIGVGSAGGFLGASKIISQWFDRKNYAKFLGISVGVGLCGAVCGGTPTYSLVEKFGVNPVAFSIVCFGLILGCAVWLVVRSPDQEQSAGEFLKFSHLKELIVSPSIWILGIVNLLFVGPLEGFADFWGERYISSFFDFTQSQAAYLMSLIFIGMMTGAPIVPMLGKKMGDYTVISLCGLGTIVAFILVFGHFLSSFHGLGAVFFMVGVFSAYQNNLLSAGTELVRPVLMGITVAFLNSWNMFGGTFFHTIIGTMMNQDSGGLSHNIPESMYIKALSCIPIAVLIGMILMGVLILYRRRHHSGIFQ